MSGFLNISINREDVFEEFPELRNDTSFQITSPSDEKYNCLAWAINKSDRFWWPHPNLPLDGCFWPTSRRDLNIENLIEAYQLQGYRLCDSWEFEDDLKKIALYVNSQGEFTHASRQLRSGLWTSKLGKWVDITHSNPYTIEGDLYGNIAKFMAVSFY